MKKFIFMFSFLFMAISCFYTVEAEDAVFHIDKSLIAFTDFSLSNDIGFSVASTGTSNGIYNYSINMNNTNLIDSHNANNKIPVVFSYINKTGSLDLTTTNKNSGKITVSITKPTKSGNYSGTSTISLSVTSIEQTITFDDNYGTTSNKEVKSINRGSSFSSLPEREREGYTLLGWYTEKEGGTKITTSTVIDSNKTYYAHWEPEKIKVDVNIWVDGYRIDVADYTGNKQNELKFDFYSNDTLMASQVNDFNQELNYDDYYEVKNFTYDTSKYTLIEQYTDYDGIYDFSNPIKGTVNHSKVNFNSKIVVNIGLITTINTYAYKNSIQSFTAPISGKFKLEVWGGQGGSISGSTGLGGYSVGTVTLNKGDVLYIATGGMGEKILTATGYNNKGGYNGGGSSSFHTGDGSHDGNNNENKYAGTGGGGATHIATKTGLLKSFSSSRGSILIVAGGGGGDSRANYVGTPLGAGGPAGGFIAGSGFAVVGSDLTPPTGATQTAGYAFGLGESTVQYDATGRKYISNNPRGNCGGGGGGGYYGGYTYHACRAPGASGGSGFLNLSKLTNARMYCYTGCSGSYTTVTSNYGHAIEKYANSGTGSAKITFVE